MLRDPTLTATQQKQAGFRPSVVARAVKIQGGTGFRFPSNKTKRGHKSGYHESFGTTDFMAALGRRRRAGKKLATSGTSRMPKGLSGPMASHPNPMREANMEAFSGASDGSRTDTAQTVLAGPDGIIAGHSGSGLSQTGQAPAHDLLREQGMHALSDPQMTPQAMEIIAAATTVATMAPGEEIRKAHGTSARIKNHHVMPEWEQKRTEGKARTHRLAELASPGDRAVAQKHMQRLFVQLPGRHLSSNGLTSPRRREDTHFKSFSGGGYQAGAASTLPAPRFQPPQRSASVVKSATEATSYVSSVFRENR